MEKKLEFKQTAHNDWQILSVIGRIDTFTASEAEKVCAEFLKENEKIALDMSELNYISSAGLRVMLRLTKQAKRDKKVVAFFAVPEKIMEVFEVSGVDMLIKIYNSVEELP